jgi:acid phosphatase
VWLFVLENHSYGGVIGNPDAPFLNQLAARYAIADRSYAIMHPSLGNYLALVAGSTLGCASDSCAPQRGTSIAGQLAARGRRWNAYLEGLPEPGWVGADRGAYVTRHDPFAYLTEVTGSPSMRAHLRPFTEFAASLRDPPAFSLVVPDNDHNMHDGTVAQADRWMRAAVGAVLRSNAFARGGAIVITWDEGLDGDHRGCCLRSIAGGRIATLVVANGMVPGTHSSHPYTHYSVLATIEDALGLPRLGLAADPHVSAMSDLWPIPSSPRSSPAGSAVP